MNTGLANALIILGGFSVLMRTGHAVFSRRIPGRDSHLYPLACFLAGTGLVFLFRLGPDLYLIRNSLLLNNLAGLQLRSLAVSFFILVFTAGYFRYEMSFLDSRISD